jgi:hypothetical protein
MTDMAYDDVSLASFNQPSRATLSNDAASRLSNAGKRGAFPCVA